MEKSIIKTPRLYTELALLKASIIELPKEKAHYLKNVMRKEVGEPLRLFNGRDGEWLGKISELSKKSASITLTERLKDQPKVARRIHGFFPPIKKHRMDFLIEKAVELGVTDLHPVLTEFTDVRKINEERVGAQILEAAEQCERLDIPVLHGMKDLKTAVNGFEGTIYSAVERGDYPHIRDIDFQDKDYGVLVGPEGGFSDQEVDFLVNCKNVKCITFGEVILRSETAFLKLLCFN